MSQPRSKFDVESWSEPPHGGKPPSGKPLPEVSQETLIPGPIPQSTADIIPSCSPRHPTGKNASLEARCRFHCTCELSTGKCTTDEMEDSRHGQSMEERRQARAVNER